MPALPLVLTFLVVALALAGTCADVAAQAVPPTARPVRVAPRLSAATVKEIASLPSNTRLGLIKLVQDSVAIYVSSNRLLIANASARARNNDGVYTPPADMRTDMVIASCGDEEFGEQLDCSSLSVSTLDGKRVTPFGYSSAPQVYRNRLGATWTVRKVLATFTASQLKNGFVVTAKEPDGTEWALSVSPDEAESTLLLRIGDPPPGPLVVSLQPYNSGWRIWSQSKGYVWRGCVATRGASTAKIGELPALGASAVGLLRFSDFTPAVQDHELTPDVTCTVAGRTHLAQRSLVLTPF